MDNGLDPTTIRRSRSVSERLGTELLARGFSRASVDLDDDDSVLGALPGGPVEDISKLYCAVFKLFVTHVIPHYTQPWLKQPVSGGGSVRRRGRNDGGGCEEEEEEEEQWKE